MVRLTVVAHHDVCIAVTVDIAQRDGSRIVSCRPNRARLSEAGFSVVNVDGTAGFVPSGNHDVEVAVAVHIPDRDAGCTRRVAGFT